MLDGTNVFRNSRLEEREAKKFEADRHQRREKLFLKIQEEFEKECQQPGQSTQFFVFVFATGRMVWTSVVIVLFFVHLQRKEDQQGSVAVLFHRVI